MNMLENIPNIAIFTQNSMPLLISVPSGRFDKLSDRTVAPEPYQAPASENSVCKMYVGMSLAADEYLCSGSLWQCSLKKRGCHSK